MLLRKFCAGNISAEKKKRYGYLILGIGLVLLSIGTGVHHSSISDSPRTLFWFIELSPEFIDFIAGFFVGLSIILLLTGGFIVAKLRKAA